MLEIIVHGLYIGAPHDVAAAGALVTWGGEVLVRFQESYRRTDIRSPLAAELRILGTALEWARERGGMGEPVIIRTALGSLASTCQGRGAASDPSIRPWLDSLERVAADFEGVHTEISPAWVTAPAQEAALRSLIGLLESPEGRPSEEPGSPASRQVLGASPARAPNCALPAAPAEAPEGGRR